MNIFLINFNVYIVKVIRLCFTPIIFKNRYSKRTDLSKCSIYDIMSFFVVMQMIWNIAFFQARLFCGDHMDLVLFFLLHFPCMYILWGHFYDKNHFVDRYYHSEPVTRYHIICNIRRDIHNLRCKLRIYRGKKITKLE